MKLQIKLLICCFACVVVSATAQVKLPVLSPKAKVVQQAGLTEIELSYSRPSAKGRVIFAQNGLVPFGKFWRTGANAATKITFGSDVVIAGTTLKKGAYAILTKPNATAWEVYFYPYTKSSWPSYVPQEPALKTSAKVSQTSDATESFEIRLENITYDTVDLIFAWDQTNAQLQIQLPTKAQALKNINRMASGPSNNEYFQAALYLHTSQSNLEQALTYIQKVTKNEKALFFQVYREAAILSDLNRKKEALAAAKRSLQLSEKANNADFIKLNKDLIQELSK
jgi:tetratricopeptide (TPR) repeat protein